MMFWLSFGFFALHNALGLATRQYSLLDAFDPANRAHLAAVVVALGIWQLARRRPLSPDVLVALDFSGMAVQSICYSFMGALSQQRPSSRMDLVTTLVIVHLQMARAVMVPSTAARTAAVGVATSLPTLAVGYHVGTWFEGI